MADQTIMEQQETMLTTSDAQPVLTDTEVTTKPSAVGGVLKTVGTVALLGASLGVGYKVADAACDWLSRTIRISKAKKAAALAEKQKILEEKKEAESVESSADAEKVLADTQ